MKQGIYIHYAEDILVKDEKVSDSNNFQRQRLRWMTGQVQALIRMLPYLPKAVMTGNINYIDKTVQQALIPRSILLILTPLLTLFSLAVFGFTFPTVMWAALLCVLVFSLYNAIPSRMRSRAILNNLRVLPKLTWRMMLNFAHIRPQNKEFIHTTHKQ
jgi:cellulose synthase/poly-beta-1,6-N-acetylglucosamine synthase-like glycosyltransferase